MTKPIYLPDLEDWCRSERAEAKDPGREPKTAERALALFETVDIEAAGLDPLIRKVVEALSGEVVVETDRGLLCRFRKPLDAALAALNLKRATRLLNLKTRAGLTWGLAPTGKRKGALHLRHETARRCLKIFSIAVPHQILIDDDFRSALGAAAAAYPEILISDPARVELAGVGQEDLMELTASDTGFAAPTGHHVPALGDIETSPVQVASFPAETDPARYLVCDTCEKPLKDDGSDGMLVIERDENVLRRFHLFHKGECDTVKSHSWRDLSEFANPECYIQFVIALFNNWAVKGMKLEDSKGLDRLLMGMYRKVFRATTGKEHLNFIGIMRLIRLMGE